MVLLVLWSCAAFAQDVESGKDVFGPCAGCHGRYGEGGKGGEYPRLAGQPTAYLVEQLVAFQDRKRKNLPMFPYTEPRELSQRDMKDVAAYLHQLQLLTRAPEFKPTDGALERLKAMERVIVVPRIAGDVEQGQVLYAKRCGSCHGHTGQGKKEGYAGLVGQYPRYLQRQLAAFVKGERAHENDEVGGLLNELSARELNDILAWLTAIQDRDPAIDGADGGSL
jgi:cytochrome c553